MNSTVLILAAGLGTRLAPYTNATPKPMFTYAGRPLLHYWIMRLAKLGCGQILVNTHHLHTQIEAYLTCNTWPVPVQTFYEPSILGTAGAIKNTALAWDKSGPLWVVNGDIVCDYDLSAFAEWHTAGRNEVSLLLTNDKAFNTVSLDANANVTGFDAQGAAEALTFTGIQLLTPAVLEYLPEGVFYNSIDAYRAMIKDGHKVKGFTALNAGWQDLGDVARYRAAAFNAGARKAFGKAFNDNGAFTATTLKGDGSDRAWFRLSTVQNSMVACDHGLTPPQNAGQTTEAQAFINTGRHLNAKGLPVAQIYFHDAFAGLVFCEDLGSQNLQNYVLNTSGKASIIAVYQQVIDALVAFSQTGVKGFNPAWSWQSPSYDSEVVLKLECGYFKQRFVEEYLGLDTAAFDLQPEFEFLAAEIGRHAFLGLMHRDLQSRNIMLKNGRPYFIDYQAARLGPLQYDLAALLEDPYAALDAEVKNLLLSYCLNHKALLNARDRIAKGYYYCALSRTMQALGAYAFLSQIKGKPWFTPYMQPALNNLNRLLTQKQGAHFKALKALAANCQAALKQKL